MRRFTLLSGGNVKHHHGLQHGKYFMTSYVCSVLSNKGGTNSANAELLWKFLFDHVRSTKLTIKGGRDDATRSIIQRWTGQRGCLCLESTPLYAVQSLQLWGREWWRMCCASDLGDSEGGSQKENKFITLPYLHILLPKDLSMRTVKKWEGLILSSESY